MLSIARRVHSSLPSLQFIGLQFQSAHAAGSSSPHRRQRSKFSPSAMLKKVDDKSDWWVVDGEMHEIGENVPPRERFVISRQNIPNKRRKQLREQFMRRTRLVLKESVSTYHTLPLLLLGINFRYPFLRKISVLC